MDPENPSGPTPTETLFGGVTLDLQTAGGAVVQVKARQLPLTDYERALGLVDDEFKFMSFVCGQPPEWSTTLHPDSYETLVAEVTRVNQAFFAYAVRRAQAAMNKVALLPPKMAEKFMGEALVQINARSPVSPPPSRRAHT